MKNLLLFLLFAISRLTVLVCLTAAVDHVFGGIWAAVFFFAYIISVASDAPEFSR